MMIKIPCLLLLFCTFQVGFSQNNISHFQDSVIKAYKKDGMTVGLGIDVLLYIHYEGVKEENRPKCALFYFSDDGSHQIKTSNSWELESASDIILNSTTNYSSCQLEKEEAFESLDMAWIKKQLLENTENDQANFIYYDPTDSTGYFRTYRLLTNTDE